MYMDRKQVAWAWDGRRGDGLQRGMRKLWGVIGILVAMIAWLQTCQTYYVCTLNIG